MSVRSRSSDMRTPMRAVALRGEIVAPVRRAAAPNFAMDRVCHVRVAAWLAATRCRVHAATSTPGALLRQSPPPHRVLGLGPTIVTRCERRVPRMAEQESAAEPPGAPLDRWMTRPRPAHAGREPLGRVAGQPASVWGLERCLA